MLSAGGRARNDESILGINSDQRKYIEVIAIVEGKTEQVFIERILRPNLAQKGIFISATQISKPGQKGGDVRFERVIKDLEKHLKQRHDTYITTFIDYYGIKQWPSIDNIPQQANPLDIAKHINHATKIAVNQCFSPQCSEERFIPYLVVHEFEALLFSDSQILADMLEVKPNEIIAVLKTYGSPEAINNSPNTAPSKRLDAWASNKKFAKTTQGIEIAERIGIAKMREQCQLFNQWIAQFETIIEAKSKS